MKKYKKMIKKIFIFSGLLLFVSCSTSIRSQKDMEGDESGQIKVNYRNQSSGIELLLDPSDRDLYLDISGNVPEMVQNLGGDATGSGQQSVYDSNLEERLKRFDDRIKEISETVPTSKSYQKDNWSEFDAQRTVKDDYFDREITQKVVEYIRKAQEYFYRKDFRNCILMIDQSLKIQETADAYALRGSVFYVLNKPKAARVNWEKALQFNPDIPGVLEMIEKLDRKGL